MGAVLSKGEPRVQNERAGTCVEVITLKLVRS